MKRIAVILLGIILIGQWMISPVLAAENGIWANTQGQDLTIYLSDGNIDDTYTLQIADTLLEITTVNKLVDLETPIETVVLLAPSVSITEADQALIDEILNDLIANRMDGEKYTIVVAGDTLRYLCRQEANYNSIKNTLMSITYTEEKVHLTHGIFDVLNDMMAENTSTLKRLVVISDGEEAPQIGYTRGELEQQIRNVGYPIYTVGCVMEPDERQMENLKEFISLYRLTDGAGFYFGETRESMTIVNGITEWNLAVCLQAVLPDKVCDGTVKTIGINGSDGNHYSVSVQTSFASTKTRSNEENPFSMMYVIIPLGCIVLAGASFALFKVISRKKQKMAFAPIPEEDGGKTKMEPDETELYEEDPGGTSIIWGNSAKPIHRLILQDKENKQIRYTIDLRGKVIIGRDPSVCQVVISGEKTVARTQCEVYERDGWILLRNLSSTNITKVDGNAVDGEWELADGCTVKMGRLEFTVEVV